MVARPGLLLELQEKDEKLKEELEQKENLKKNVLTAR